MAVEALVGIGGAGDGIVLGNEIHRPFAEVGNGIGEAKQFMVGRWIILDVDVKGRKRLEVRVVDRVGGIGVRHANCERNTTKAGSDHHGGKTFHEQSIRPVSRVSRSFPVRKLHRRSPSAFLLFNLVQLSCTRRK